VVYEFQCHHLMMMHSERRIQALTCRSALEVTLTIQAQISAAPSFERQGNILPLIFPAPNRFARPPPGPFSSSSCILGEQDIRALAIVVQDRSLLLDVLESPDDVLNRSYLCSRAPRRIGFGAGRSL
jgi:hypothetical protein